MKQMRSSRAAKVMLQGSGLSQALFPAAMVVALFLLFPAILPASTGGEEAALSKGDLYALVVGVANYQNDRLKLNVSAKDARDFAEFLDTQKKVFRKTYVTLLVDEKATKREIEKQLQYEFLKAGKDDTVIVFLSGHGDGDPKKPGEYFFLGSDADPDYLESSAVKMSGLDFLRGIDAQRVLVIADACHAGAFSRTRTERKTKAAQKEMTAFARHFAESSGRMVLTSSKPEQYSQEGEKNSIFTHHLLRGLNGTADADRDRVVTLKELYDYVYDQTKTQTDGAQHPQLEGQQVGSFPVSVLGTMKEPIKLEAQFIAQDPRCKNKLCTDPPDYRTVCNDPHCRDVAIEEGDTMYSGQNYQIAVRPSFTSYLYVYQVGPKGDVYRLFPGTDYLTPENPMANPLKGGEIHWIPAKNAWLRQDDQVGKEKIYVVASRSRNQILEDLYAHLEKLRRGEQLPASAAPERPPAAAPVAQTPAVPGATELDASPQVAPMPTQPSQGLPAQEHPSGSAKAAQAALIDYLEQTMAPTKAIIRKPMPIPSDDQKIRIFEELKRIFESPTLDAVRSVSFQLQTR